MPKRFAGFYRKGGYYGRYNRNAKYAMGRELKFFDTTITSSDYTDSGNISLSTLFEIPTGTTESTRIGRKLTVKKISFHGLVHLDTDTGVATGHYGYRTIVYLDKQANGTTATPLDILETTGILVGYNSFRNLANTGRFSILYDKRSVINTNGIASTSQTITKVANLDFFIPMNLPVEYSGTLGLLTEIRSNNVGLLLIQQGVLLNVNLSGTFRVRYEG